MPSNGTCSPEYFHCVKDKYCIAEELQCNGYNNCGNGTDEESCMVLPDHTGFHQNPGTGDHWSLLSLHKNYVVISREIELIESKFIITPGSGSL